MNVIRRKAIAEDLRKVGTTAFAAALVSVFLSAEKALTACALVLGVVFWLIGIFLRRR